MLQNWSNTLVQQLYRDALLFSVVFAGFNVEELVARISNCMAKVVMVLDFATRAGRPMHLKRTVDEAVRLCSSVRKVMVFKSAHTTLAPALINSEIDMFISLL